MAVGGYGYRHFTISPELICVDKFRKTTVHKLKQLRQPGFMRRLSAPISCGWMA